MRYGKIAGRRALMTAIPFFVFIMALVWLIPIPANANLQDTNPRTAWYYNSQAEGTGVSIEIKDGVLFMAWYTYNEATGEPIWYTAGGEMTDADHFSGALLSWTGWELGAGYTAPVNTQVGTVNLTFTSDTTVTIVWTLGALGGELQLTNFLDALAPGTPDPRDINGWWAFPGYDGMGLFIEAQGGSLFLAWYNYGIGGLARWWSSPGTNDFPEGATIYDNILVQYANGQCPGCDIMRPDDAVTVSQIKVEFLGGGRATLTWDGGSYDLVRFPLSSFNSRLYAMGTDFQTTTASSVSIPGFDVVPGPGNVTPDIAIFDSGDNQAEQCDDYVFVIRRLGVDAIQVYLKNNLATPIADYSVNEPGGTNADPHDILMLTDSKAYVTRYGLSSLLIVNPLTGAQLGTIDLSAYADADGIPEMDKLVYVDTLAGGKVFVTCQRLDQFNFFSPTDTSVVVVIDPATDAVTNSITLTSVNPYQLKYNPGTGKLVCAEVGSFFTSDGGLELIDPFTETAEGLAVTNETLGVVATTDFVFINNQQVFALMTTSTFGTQVRRLDLTTGTAVATVAASEGFDFPDPLAFSQNLLFVSDQNTGNPGVRVFDGSTNVELTATPLGIGSLPPSYLITY